MQLFTWTTQDVPRHDSFHYWREAVCRAVLDVSTVQPRETDFQAEIAARTTDLLTYISFRSSGHDIQRDEASAARAREESYLLSLQLSGTAEIQQGSAEVTLTPGNMAIVESWRPFHVRFNGPVTRVLAVVPRRVLNTRIDGLRMIPGSVAFADLLRDHLQRLSNPNLNVSEAAAQVLGQNVCNLIDVTCLGSAGKRRASQETQRALLLHFIQMNLRDPRLGPAKAAAHLGISVRSVHNLLVASGKTFGSWVLDERLKGCAGALRDRAWADRPIAEIAYAWGFVDQSHFNHSFKTRFAMTPGEMRFSQ